MEKSVQIRFSYRADDSTKTPHRDRSDNELMEAFKLGDDRSFDILYDKHFKPLFIFQQRNMCWISREDAEDLTDEAFLAVIRAKDRFDVHRAFKPWLFKIAYNIKVTFLRRTKAAPQIVVEPFGRDPRRTLILESCAE